MDEPTCKGWLVKADHVCGLWDDCGRGAGPDDPEINASDEYVKRFDFWLGKYPFIEEGSLDLDSFNQEGRALAYELKKIVGPSINVTYVYVRPSDKTSTVPDQEEIPYLQDNENRIKALDELFIAVKMYKKSDDFKSLIDFIQRFPDIAPYNAMLINIQKPGSHFVATATQWRKKYGRTIKPNATPLVILQPFGPLSFVFELADTEGKAFPDKLLNPFRVQGKVSQDIMETLHWNLPRDGIAYYESDSGTSYAGSINLAKQNAFRKLIRANDSIMVHVFYDMIVNKRHSDTEKFATILHELAHLYCGHLGTPKEKWTFWPKNRGLIKHAAEFEAESVAWLVCKRLDIHNPSEEYLSGYLTNKPEIPDISLEAVLKATAMVESMLDGHLPLRKEIIFENTR